MFDWGVGIRSFESLCTLKKMLQKALSQGMMLIKISFLFFLIKKVVIDLEDERPHMFMLWDSQNFLQEIFCPELIFFSEERWWC